MGTIAKFSSQIIEVAYDFADKLVLAAAETASYAILAEPGITVYDARLLGTTILLKIGDGSAGQKYDIVVRATTENDLVYDVSKTISVRALPAVAPLVAPPPFAGTILTNDIGEVLTISDGTGLQL